MCCFHPAYPKYRSWETLEKPLSPCSVMPKLLARHQHANKTPKSTEALVPRQPAAQSSWCL